MKKLIRDCKGAVTVMVTLLLIPAILVTGTGVDIARVYAARSTLQDANQLALNSVLASYDALLQDLYGLFGVMQEDENFAGMVNDYLELAVLGEDWVDRGMGSFQLFYGSDPVTAGVTPAPGKNLGEAAVLRRQIEEYSKFRAPAIVVQEVLDKLDTFEKVQEDAKVIKKKMEVDNNVEKLDKIYRDIYDCIEEIKPCEKTEVDAVDAVTACIREIQSVFQSMHRIRKDYTDDYRECEENRASYEENWKLYQKALDALASEDDEEEDEDDEPYVNPQQYKDKCDQLNIRYNELQEQMRQQQIEYEECVDKVRVLVKGGNISGSPKEGWKNITDRYVRELKRYIEGPMPELIRLCEQADSKKEDLRVKLEQLKTQLNSGKCTKELKDGLEEVSEKDQKSVIQAYEELLEYDLSTMAQAMCAQDGPQIEQTIELLKDAQFLADSPDCTCSELENLLVNDLPIEYLLGEGRREGDSSDYLHKLARNTLKVYNPAGPGFKHFNDREWFGSTKNPEFYNEVLIPMCKTEVDRDKKKNAKKNITKVFEEAQKLFSNGLTFTPEGAEYLTGGMDDSDESTGTDFGTAGDWSQEDKGKEELEKSLDNDFLKNLTDAAGAIGNKALLMVYATEMFSNYSSPRLQGEKKVEPDLSMAGIPLSTEVNYYYHSEQEFLYNGNLANAKANLISVAGMILLVRFVFNYIASFSVSSVKTVVNSIRSTLAPTGPFAVLASELARMGLAIGESAMDVERLRSGEKVALFKKNDNWRFSISGLADSITSDVTDSIKLEKTSQSDDTSKEGDEEPGSLAYTDYLRLFLLLVNGDDLANRIRELIQLNLTNYSEEINADEEKMASAERFDMSKAFTDFSLSTSAEMRMLFLSMPLAQRGVNSVIPPRTMPITATDYRGY